LENSLLTKLLDKNILVIGDIIVDEFIFGRPARVSREAPVIIMEETDREVSPGGAANAAANIASLGGKAELLGLVGGDNYWGRLKKNLSAREILCSDILVNNRMHSAVKTRVVAGGEQVVSQQVVRIDNTMGLEVSSRERERLLSSLTAKISSIEAIILSDYGLGLFNKSFNQKIISLAQEEEVPVLVDSRYQLLDFVGATIATPNLEETARLRGAEISDQQEVIRAGKSLLKDLQSQYLLITQGSEGMTLFFKEGNYQHIPVENKVEVYDVTGAGDTVVATLALALGAGFDIITAVELANKAAGIVVSKPGVATVKPEELVQVMANEK